MTSAAPSRPKTSKTLTANLPAGESVSYQLVSLSNQFDSRNELQIRTLRLREKYESSYEKINVVDHCVTEKCAP